MTDHSYMDPCGCTTDSLGYRPCESCRRAEWQAECRPIVSRLAAAYAIADPARARADAERWRRQGHTMEADAVDAALRFWRVVFEQGFGRAIEDEQPRKDAA